MDEERPRYGYGKGGRPLWSPRDRDAEAIRRVLRRAGLRDVDERHLDGFAVEGANTSLDGPEPFAVSHCGTRDQAHTLARYRRALEQAGYLVEADPADDTVLLVPRQPGHAASPGRALLRNAVACAVAATVAMVASYVGSGPLRLVGGIGAAVFGVLAVFMAGLWYQWRDRLE